LAECGVSLVVELPLRNSKMDGIVSFSTGNPVIGLTTRGDRMDGFVFTLLHEIAHLTLGHVGPGGLGVDEDLDPNGGSERERAANEMAAAWIFPTPPKLPPGELTPRTLVETARAHRVHVCFLIGRLQNQGRLEWKEYRRQIPQVRPYVELG
ncbi:MAG: ImmA/IrrE family metallo-endopeptidase, partial [Nocardioidaceae bacterium]